MISSEHRIENRIMYNLDRLGYGGAEWIRRARISRGYGTVDLMILPKTGPHRLVLVEVKQPGSAEASGKVVGQLLRYYVGARGLGHRGLRLLREFATTPAARTPKPKSLQMISGGLARGEDWQALQAGRPLSPKRIAAAIGLSRPPSESLLAMRDWMEETSGVRIEIVVARSRSHVEIL